jgi:hypothetical protein
MLIDEILIKHLYRELESLKFDYGMKSCHFFDWYKI